MEPSSFTAMISFTNFKLAILRDLVWILAAALVWTVAGCAARQVSAPPLVRQLPTAASALAKRSRTLTSLQTPAIMEYAGPAGHFKVREQVTVRCPASLRVEAMSPLGIALIVAADDRQIAVFNPSNNTLMRGAANAATLARFTQIPMEPAQAVQLLLGLAPDNSMLAAAPSSTRSEGEMTVLAYAGAGTASYELGFSRGQLALVRARGAAGRVAYEVNYSDYRDIGAMEFPFAIEARFLTNATTIKLHYLKPAIDRQIADSTFVLSPGPGTRLIELGWAAPVSLQAIPG
jgi:outer membrane lipoprotein-sorting protein